MKKISSGLQVFIPSGEWEYNSQKSKIYLTKLGPSRDGGCIVSSNKNSDFCRSFDDLLINSDINADGVVDDADLLEFLFNFDKTKYSNSKYDINGDGEVTDDDLQILLKNFGRRVEVLKYADLNNDGLIDDTDLLQCLFEFETNESGKSVQDENLTSDYLLKIILKYFGQKVN